MGIPRTVRRSFFDRLLGNRSAASAACRRRRPLRLEPLEQREMLAVADATGGSLHYKADAGEVNDVVLSPGRFFSIQDAADVAQVGLGGCVASSFLASLSWSVGADAGTSVGIGAEVEVGVSVGFGGALMGINLPEGIIAPSPSHLTTAGNVSDALQQSFGNITKGVSSVVAGAPVAQAGSVYYDVSASSGTVDEYRLYQSIVDPAAAIHETESNDKFGQANAITTGTLVEGDFSAGAGDADFFKFTVLPGDRIAVALDNDPLRDGQYANTRLTLYDSTGKELSSNVSFSDASAVGAIEVPGAVLPGPYYVSVADNGFGKGTHYRFVVLRSNSPIDEDVPKPVTFDSGTLNTPLPDLSTTESTLPVSLDDPFARANSMSVTLNIAHTYDADLSAYLISPSGTTVALFENVGGSGDNFTNTTFSDSAALPIALGSAPFTGTFRPAGSLSSFANDLINGEWKLRVVDSTGGDVGTLVGWKLTFNVANNDTPANADPLALNQYANGDVPSGYDSDYFTVSSATIQPGNLVFAYVDTYDTDKENTDARDSYLKVIGADGTTVLGEDDDDGPAVSNDSYDKFDKDLQAAGVDLDKLVSFNGDLVVDLKDGNDRCDASKINLVGQKITINGDDGSDTIFAPGGDQVYLNGGYGNDTFVANAYAPATVNINGGPGLNDTLAIEGAAGNDLIAIRMSGNDLLVSVNGVVSTFKDILAASIENLAIDTGGGDDVVTVDCSGGPIVFANGIGVTFDGSAARLVLTSGLVQVDSNALTLGPVAGSGTSTIEMSGKTQVVEFTGTSPVQTTLVTDQVLGPMEIVATDADNAITLDQRADPGTALMSVDDLAAMQLANKTSLTIEAGAGNDTVHLQKAAGKALVGAAAPLIVNGGSGDDTLLAEDGLELAASVTLDGGAGNDTLRADATLLGGPGDDTLLGGPGSNTYDGGAGFDTILFQGTLLDDAIVLEQTDAATLKHSIVTGGVTASGTDAFSAVEMVRVDAGSGDDSVQIKVADALAATPGASLPFGISGDGPNASDRLTVWDAGLGDCTLWREGPDGRSGSIAVGPLSPVNYSAIEHVDIMPCDAVADGYGEDLKGRLVILPTDPLEGNNSRRVAGDFEDLTASHVHPTIDPRDAGSGLPQDEDWYRFVASQTGTFRFQLDYQAIGALANGRAGLPGDGKLVIQLYDALGTPIAKEAAEGDASQTIGVAKDGVYYVRVTGATADVVNVYDVDLIDVDTFGPQVTGVSIAGQAAYNLFTQKQAGGGNVPTPLVGGLTIGIQDLVAAGRVTRFPGYAYPALDVAMDLNPGHYRLVGDANGVIPIAGVTLVNDPLHVGLAEIQLLFDTPLPDDRYTLTISDGVLDPAGNGFDGETNTVEPHAAPAFPSGDSVALGDFMARFTIDSRPEIGAWCAGSVYVDTNGNFESDLQNTDATNRDLTYVLGYTSDYVLAGNFGGPGADGRFGTADDAAADGFDKLAVYGKVGKQSRWMIDNTNDGVADLVQYDPANLVGTPVAGDFDRNPANGDEVGLFTGKEWRLDGNHDFKVSGSARDIRVKAAHAGLPIAGDFDGDGFVDLATYSNGVFYFDLTKGTPNGWDGRTDATITGRFNQFIGVRERPVAADMDGDGVTDVGLWVPDRNGTSSTKNGEWYWLLSNDFAGTKRVPGTVKTQNHPFSPAPLGQDLAARYGNEYSAPVVGNFDPPPAKADGHPDVPVGSLIVNMVGTAARDSLVFAPGSQPNTWKVTLNGKPQTFTADSIALTFDGRGGADTANLTGTNGDDHASLWPGRGSLVGDGYSVEVAKVRTIMVDGRGGANKVDFFGSAGSDVFAANSMQDRMTGRDFANTAMSFQTASVEGRGGRDTALIHDAALAQSAGSDGLSGLPSPYHRAVWLDNVENVTLKKKGKTSSIFRALDQVLAAYW